MKKTILLWPALAVLVLDQITKHLVASRFPIHESRPLINGFLDLVHVRNRGMAFGILNRPGADWASVLLLAVTLAAVALLLFWFYRMKERDRGLGYPLCLILGGASGNLLDRLRMGEVVDFIDFHIGSTHWPAFNVADSAITVGTFWLALTILLHPTPKEHET